MKMRRVSTGSNVGVRPCSVCGSLFKPRTSERRCKNCPASRCSQCGKPKRLHSKHCRSCDEKLRSERAKALGYGKWMSGRSLPRSQVEKARVRSKRTKEVVENTGAVQIQHLMRKHSNRRHFLKHPRSKDPEARDKHNGDWRYKEWRTAVLQRDDYVCQICGKRGGALHAHHVKKWAAFPDLRYDIANGLTVCEDPCHKSLHPNGTRV
jgi:5-methylcytosine-specific restriction endonuclease McrA